MDNSTATPLQGKLLLLNQLELVTPTTVAGTLYGIAFALFCLYVHALAPRFRDGNRKRKAKFMLGYSSVIMLCGLYKLVSNAWIAQDAYIKHGNYPGGPYIYEEATSHTPVVITIFASELVVNMLTSAIQSKVWRVWVVWSATRYAKLVIVLPSLCLLAFTTLQLRTIILEATLPIPEVRRLDTKTELAEFALQGAITILCTMLISLYLIFHHWRQRKLIGRALAQGSIGHMNIIAMLIESYALESIWLLIVAITINDTVSAFFNESVRYIQIIAYLLVLHRVAAGTAYESQRGQSNISSLHWNHSNHITSQFVETGELCVRPSPHSVPKKPEALEVLPASSMA